MMGQEDVIVTGRELATLIGCRPSYVVELKRLDRLVPAPTGKGYLKRASLALYEQTKDPSRAGVASRHAEARGTPLHGEEGSEDEGDDDAEGGSGSVPLSSDAKRKAKALADKAETDARMAQIELAKTLGDLLPATEVERVLSEASTALRVALEGLADTLAPQLAAMTDEGRCRQLVWDEVAHALEELSRGFKEAIQPSREAAQQA